METPDSASPEVRPQLPGGGMRPRVASDVDISSDSDSDANDGRQGQGRAAAVAPTYDQMASAAGWMGERQAMGASQEWGDSQSAYMRPSKSKGASNDASLGMGDVKGRGQQGRTGRALPLPPYLEARRASDLARLDSMNNRASLGKTLVVLLCLAMLVYIFQFWILSPFALVSYYVIGRWTLGERYDPFASSLNRAAYFRGRLEKHALAAGIPVSELEHMLGGPELAYSFPGAEQRLAILQAYPDSGSLTGLGGLGGLGAGHHGAAFGGARRGEILRERGGFMDDIDDPRYEAQDWASRDGRDRGGGSAAAAQRISRDGKRRQSRQDQSSYRTRKSKDGRVVSSSFSSSSFVSSSNTGRKRARDPLTAMQERKLKRGQQSGKSSKKSSLGAEDEDDEDVGEGEGVIERKGSENGFVDTDDSVQELSTTGDKGGMGAEEAE